MKGFPFPDIPKLEQAMVLRGWDRALLAEKSGLPLSVVYRVLAGKSVMHETIEAVSKALIDNPPDTAVAEFLAESAS
jgi:predicted transcriptional regulator